MNGEGEERPNEPDLPEDTSSSEFEPQPRSTANYANYVPPPKPPKEWKRWLMWVGIIFIMLVAVALGYKLIQKKPAVTPSSNSNQTGQNQTPQTSTATISTATKNYSSQNFTLSFDYPNDWSLTDSGGGLMTVKSPAISLSDINSKKVSTDIVLNFRNKTLKLTEFDAGNATAERDSTKIAYTKPTQTQRGDTFVSFLRYAKSKAGIDEVCITGNSGYKSGQAIPLVDMTKVDPVICISFTSDTGNTKQPTVPVTIASATWDDPAITTPLINIFKSLVIK